MNSETITSIGYAIGSFAALITAISVLLKRQGIARWFSHQSTLIRRVLTLEAEVLRERAAAVAVKREAEAAQMAADYWESTAKAGRTMRDDFDAMSSRIAKNEQRGDIVMRALREVLRHQGVLEAWFIANGHALPEPSPVIPVELRKELEG